MAIFEGSLDCASNAKWVIRSPASGTARLNGDSRYKGEVSAADIKAAKERARAMLQRLARSLSRSGVPNL